MILKKYTLIPDDFVQSHAKTFVSPSLIKGSVRANIHWCDGLIRAKAHSRKRYVKSIICVKKITKRKNIFLLLNSSFICQLFGNLKSMRRNVTNTANVDPINPIKGIGYLKPKI